MKRIPCYDNKRIQDMNELKIVGGNCHLPSLSSRTKSTPHDVLAEKRKMTTEILARRQLGQKK